jgi:hypothetical protein
MDGAVIREAAGRATVLTFDDAFREIILVLARRVPGGPARTSLHRQ